MGLYPLTEPRSILNSIRLLKFKIRTLGRIHEVLNLLNKDLHSLHNLLLLSNWIENVFMKL